MSVLFSREQNSQSPHSTASLRDHVENLRIPLTLRSQSKNIRYKGGKYADSGYSTSALTHQLRNWYKHMFKSLKRDLDQNRTGGEAVPSVKWHCVGRNAFCCVKTSQHSPCFSSAFKTRLPHRSVGAEFNVLKHEQFSPRVQQQINMCTVEPSLQNSHRQPPNYSNQQFAKERLLKPFIAIQATKGCPSTYDQRSLAYQSTL